MIAIDDNVDYLLSYALYTNGNPLLPAHKSLVISRLKDAILALDKETLPIISVCQTGTASAFHRDLSDVLDELQRDCNIVLRFPGIIYLKDNGYTHLKHADPAQFPLPGTATDDVTVKFTGTTSTQEAQQTPLSLAINPRQRRTGIYVGATGPFYNGYPHSLIAHLPPLPASRRTGLFASLALPTTNAPHSIAAALYPFRQNPYPIVSLHTRRIFTTTPEQLRIMLAGLQALQPDDHPFVFINDHYPNNMLLPPPPNPTKIHRIVELVPEEQQTSTTALQQEAQHDGDSQSDDDGYSADAAHDSESEYDSITDLLARLDIEDMAANTADGSGAEDSESDDLAKALVDLFQTGTHNVQAAFDPAGAIRTSPSVTPSFSSAHSSRNNSNRSSPALSPRLSSSSESGNDSDGDSVKSDGSLVIVKTKKAS